MPNFNRRLERQEARQRGENRPLKVILHLAPEELTDKELAAVILGCEPWKVARDLMEEELTAMAGGIK